MDSNCETLSEDRSKPAVLCDAINRIQTLRAKLATVDGQYRSNLMMMGKKRKIDRSQEQATTNQNGLWIDEAMKNAGFPAKKMKTLEPEQMTGVGTESNSSTDNTSPRGQMVSVSLLIPRLT